MNFNGKQRRDFLKQLGAGAMMLPVLPSLLASQKALGAVGKPPVRVVIFWGFNGMYDSAFWPQATPTNQVMSGVFATPLSSVQGPLSGVIGSDFDTLRTKFSLIRGLSQAVSPYGADNIIHDCSSVLALSHVRENNDSYGADAPKVGSSFDSILEHSSGFYPTNPVLRALRISGGDPKWSISTWRPSGGSTPPFDQVQKNGFIDHDPLGVFNTLFPNGPMKASAPQVSQVAPPYKSKVFDALLSRFNALSKSTALSGSDKERLKSHTDMLNDLKGQVMAASPSGGGLCSSNTPGATNSLAAKYDANFDSIVSAFSCDTTRLVFYTIDHFDDAGKVGWDHDHANSHSDFTSIIADGVGTGDGTANCSSFRGWQAKRIASFMKKLDSVKDIDGQSTLLDNTIVIWANQHGGAHCISNYPILVGGGGGGMFRTGLYLDYRTRANGDPGDRTVGRPLGNLWTAVMRAAGVPASEYLLQGEDGGYGQGLRSGDGFASQYGPNLAQMRREHLPYFYTGT
jgi:hypothetical protein